MVMPAAEREAVTHLRSVFEMSERRACTMIGICRMTVRYRSSRPDDGLVRERLDRRRTANVAADVAAAIASG